MQNEPENVLFLSTNLQIVTSKDLKAISKQANRLIGKAMHEYNMLAPDDKVLIAVSGGIDSLVLTWILRYWQSKTPFKFKLLAVHLDMGFGENENVLVKKQLDGLSVPYLIEQTTIGEAVKNAEAGKSVCFHCSKKRRNRLFEIAKEQDCNKIAFGHHKDDIIETFFLNIMYSGNISTMLPKQTIFNGSLSIIRPLAYLEKEAIYHIGGIIGVVPVKNPCPFSETSKREEIRDRLNIFLGIDPKIKSNIFAALANVKQDYLLKPNDF